MPLVDNFLSIEQVVKLNGIQDKPIMQMGKKCANLQPCLFTHFFGSSHTKANLSTGPLTIPYRASFSVRR